MLAAIIKYFGPLAQLVEQLTLNRGVRNDLKLCRGSLAQLVEQLTLNQWVRGSSPRRSTTTIPYNIGDFLLSDTLKNKPKRLKIFTKLSKIFIISINFIEISLA